MTNDQQNHAPEIATQRKDDQANQVDSDWRLEGEWIKNCNCAFGCPCDFNAAPTYGECKGVLGMHIVSGYFNDVRLDDMSFFVTVHFPGALHEGNGEAQPIIDERATAAQREALLSIMSGTHSAPGTLFHIFSLIITRMHAPAFGPVEFSFDQTGRVARVKIPNILDTDVEPIRNPVTGTPHRIQVVMPEGFEHRIGEVASATIHSTGAIRFDTVDSHSTLAHVVQTPQGVAA